MRADGKIVLVTGAQQGIGRATAIAFAREGADVVVNYLDDRGAAETVAKEIRDSSRRCALVQADVSSARDVERLVGEAEAALGPIDVVVNNAGVFPRRPFLELTEQDWDFVLGVNVKGAFLTAQAVARRLVARGAPGVVVNVSSGAAYRGSPRGVHYVTSKAGVVGLTRAMALELAPHRIRVNAVAPGLTDTAQPRYGATEAELAARAREVPLGRMVEPGEIAAAIVFLASDEARQVTGQILHVNGGAYLG